MIGSWLANTWEGSWAFTSLCVLVLGLTLILRTTRKTGG